MEEIRYNHLNKFLKDKFGEKVLKICVDGDFTCPNRDGSKGIGGCVFCGSQGAGDLIKYKCNESIESIKNQVNGFLNSYRGERANKFVVYFQSFTSTYDTLSNLKLKYDTALACNEKIMGLDVATRPDCIDEDIVKLLASYKNKYYVSVELGLQTANDEIGKNINRCYSTSDFVKAVEILHKYDIPVVAHIMVGLLGETKQDIINMVELINKCHCEGVKIHSTYVVKDTKLHSLLENGEYSTISQEYYVDMVLEIISRLNKDIVVHRITADPPKEILIAPEWTLHKKRVINSINKNLKICHITQGCKNTNG